MTNELTKQTGGVFDDAERLGAAIKKVGTDYHLVNPGGALGSQLPPLHAAGISFVFVAGENETYPIPGSSKRGLGKTVLDRLSAAAGVRWNPHLCGLIGNSTDPNLVEYQAVGEVLQMDGTARMITAVKRIDLRADKSLPVEKWGNDAQEIARVAAMKTDDKGVPRDPWPQIIQARQHILSLAESKAKNRAIRSLGIKAAYEPQELVKGFAVLRLQFTGIGADPEVNREVAMMMANRALGATSMLYGPSAVAGQLPRPERTVPKIVEAEAKEIEDDPDLAAGAEEEKVPPAAEDQGPDSDLQMPNPPPHDPQMPVGKKDPKTGLCPRKRASEMTVDQLKNLIDYNEGKKPTWSAQWKEKNQADLDALKAWLAFRTIDPNQGNLDLGKSAAADKVPY